VRFDDLDGGAGDAEETEFAAVRDNLRQRPAAAWRTARAMRVGVVFR
jgi:hypothetical protein